MKLPRDSGNPTIDVELPVHISTVDESWWVSHGLAVTSCGLTGIGWFDSTFGDSLGEYYIVKMALKHWEVFLVVKLKILTQDNDDDAADWLQRKAPSSREWTLDYFAGSRQG